MFSLTVSGVPALAGARLTRDVQIHSKLYEHPRAIAMLNLREARALAARENDSQFVEAVHAEVKIRWVGDDNSIDVPCFSGFVDRVEFRREAHRSFIILECVSGSVHSDCTPHYRAFQCMSLAAICRYVASKSEERIQVEGAADLDFDIPLSLQYGETDFAFLRRLATAWAVPLGISPLDGKITVGSRPTNAPGFPGLDYHWTFVTHWATRLPVRVSEAPEVPLGGQVHGKQAQFDRLLGIARDPAARYKRFPDSILMEKRVGSVRSRRDTCGYHMRLEGAVYRFTAGDVVSFGGGNYLIASAEIGVLAATGTVFQEFALQPLTRPFPTEQRDAEFPPQAVWAHVTDNDKDPLQQGRIQVKFDWEEDDSPENSTRVWLPTLTPYGGGAKVKNHKAGSYAGFFALPEVGERVLVLLATGWDSDGVILGVVRDATIDPEFSAKNTKRWRTPTGNEITLTTQGSAEIVRLRTKDHLILEAKIDGRKQSLTLASGNPDSDRIHLQTGGGNARLDMVCSGDILVRATGNLNLEGRSVQVKADGDARVNGATVELNGMARSMTAKGFEPLDEQDAKPEQPWQRREPPERAT